MRFNTILKEIFLDKDAPKLLTLTRGIERETIRVNNSGLSLTAHSKALGSALTHKSITTDYSESMLEFITGVHEDVDSLLDELNDIHTFTMQNLKDESFWAVSMPCCLGDKRTIPIADYGTSNSGKFKSLYRKGLTNRYGALMQVISGVHFNFSVSSELWSFLHEKYASSLSLRDFISQSYFDLIRNYQKNVWILPYLFGASPVLCKTFLQNKTHLNFKSTPKGTYYLPYATSLRMSDLGYTNKEQENLHVSYNSLDEYLKGIKRAVNTPSSKFEQIGIKEDDGSYKQINTNVLQIENEYYSPIRPKRVQSHAKTPSDALASAGVEYVEVRAIDVNPFSPLGISKDQVLFLDLFMLYCIFKDSPLETADSIKEQHKNLENIVLYGRTPDLEMMRDGAKILRTQWLNDIFADLLMIAKLLDEKLFDKDGLNNRYQSALSTWEKAIDNPSLTLSGKVMDSTINVNKEHCQWVKELNHTYKEHFLETPLSESNQKRYAELRDQSLIEQQHLEANDKVDFESYLKDFFAS